MFDRPAQCAVVSSSPRRPLPTESSRVHLVSLILVGMKATNRTASADRRLRVARPATKWPVGASSLGLCAHVLPRDNDTYNAGPRSERRRATASRVTPT